MTLTDFLLARIAEDEAVARAAADSDGERWAAAGLRYDDKFDASVVLDRSEVHVAHAEEPAAEHIARHDPARVLRRCEADRAIVQLCSADEVLRGRAGDYSITVDARRVLHTLAAVYADHPDYCEEWRP